MNHCWELLTSDVRGCKICGELLDDRQFEIDFELKELKDPIIGKVWATPWVFAFKAECTGKPVVNVDHLVTYGYPWGKACRDLVWACNAKLCKENLDKVKRANPFHPRLESSTLYKHLQEKFGDKYQTSLYNYPYHIAFKCKSEEVEKVTLKIPLDLIPNQPWTKEDWKEHWERFDRLPMNEQIRESMRLSSVWRKVMPVDAIGGYGFDLQEYRKSTLL